MKILVLSMSSQAYADLAAITDPTKTDYAKRWGYDCECVTDDELMGSRGAWRRVELWLKYLRYAGWLFFTGTDAAITNPRISLADRFSLHDTSADLIISADGNGLQSDAWIMRNSLKTQRLLSACLLWEGIANNEQDALNIELSRSNSYRAFCRRVGDLRQGGEPIGPEVLARLDVELNRSDVSVKIVPQKLINAYSNELYGSRIAGGSNQHEPGDFILHIPGQTNETRIAKFKSVLL